MFDLVNKNKTLIQIILFLTMIPFAFYGVDYYFRGTDSTGDVAQFDGGKITDARPGVVLRGPGYRP